MTFSAIQSEIVLLGMNNFLYSLRIRKYLLFFFVIRLVHIELQRAWLLELFKLIFFLFIFIEIQLKKKRKIRCHVLKICTKHISSPYITSIFLFHIFLCSSCSTFLQSIALKKFISIIWKNIRSTTLFTVFN